MPPDGEILNFDPCDLEKYVKSKTRKICDGALLDVPTKKKPGDSSYHRWPGNQYNVFFNNAP